MPDLRKGRVDIILINMRHFYFLLILHLIISSTNLSAKSLDDSTYDSLLSVWLNVEEVDSNRLQAIHSIIWGRQLFKNPDTTLILANLQLELARQAGSKKFESKAINTIGTVSRIKGDYVDAIEYFQKALEIRLQTDDKRGAANTINNIGLIYYDQGQYAKAIEHYTRSLKLQEEIKYDVGIANALTNIGLVHHVTMKYDQALDYLNKAKVIRLRINDQRGLATAYSNIGLIHKEKRSYSEALSYFEQAMDIQEAILDERNLAITLNHVSMVHYYLGDYDQAIKHQTRSVEINQKNHQKKGIIECWTNLAKIYKAKKEYAKSIEYALVAYKMADEHRYPFYVQVSSKLLYEIYKETGQLAEALQYHEVFKQTGDSLVNIETSKKILAQEFEYEYEKKQAIKDAEHNKQIAIAYEREQKQRVISYAISIGLVLVLIFTLIIVKRLKISRQQNRIIEHQYSNLREGSEKILRVEKEKHQLELAHKQRDLEMVNANNLLKLNFRRNLISDLKNLLGKSDPAKELRLMLAELRQQVNTEDKIQTLHNNFDKVDSVFLEKLASKFPNLSKTEREICAYLKLNLTIKEIANLKRSTVNNISVVRSRIRKKLSIPVEANLEGFIQNL